MNISFHKYKTSWCFTLNKYKHIYEFYILKDKYIKFIISFIYKSSLYLIIRFGFIEFDSLSKDEL